MLSLHGYPIIDWVINRVKRSKKIDKLVIAIPQTEKDNLLYEHLLKSNNIIIWNQMPSQL